MYSERGNLAVSFYNENSTSIFFRNSRLLEWGLNSYERKKKIYSYLLIIEQSSDEEVIEIDFIHIIINLDQ